MNWLLIQTNFVLLLTLTANLGLAIYIYIKNRHSEVSRVFSSVMLTIALWTLSFIAYINTSLPENILFWRRITPIGSAFVAGIFLYFSLIFPYQLFLVPHWLRYLLIIPAFLFAILSVFSNSMISGAIIEGEQYPFLVKPIFGPVYRLYSIYLVLFFVMALGFLIYKYFTSATKEKLQIFYVLVGMSLSIFIAIITSLILPMFGIPTFFVLGPAFTLIMAGFITYALARRRLLDIEDFMSRGMFVLGLVLAVVGTLACLWFRRVDLLLPFYTVFTNLILGLYVLINNPRHEINRSFALIAVSIALWAFSIFTLNSSQYFLLWGRLAFLGPAFIPAAFIYFSWVYPRRNFTIKKRHFIVLGLPVAILAILVPTNLIIRDVFVSNGQIIPVRGPVYFVLLLYFICFMIYGFRELIRKYHSAIGVQRLQLRYLFLGCFLSVTLNVVTNIVLPLFGIIGLTSFGPFFTLIFVGMVSYAIVRHRLMSVELVVQRGTVYAVATILIMAFYALAVIVSELFLRNIMGYSSLIITALAALLIAVAYQPLIRAFQQLTDRLFFRGRYDYQKILKEISQKIASVIKLEELTKLIVTSFVDTMKVSEISLLLLEKEKEHFCSVPMSLPRYKKIEIDVNSPVIAWLDEKKDIIVKDEVDEEIFQQETQVHSGGDNLRQLAEIRDEIERLGIAVWVPIVSKGELIGIIALGHKLSGDIFSSEDIRLLGTLANQTAVALDNARLYNEVVMMRDYNEDILQSMTNGVMTVDIKGKVVTFNYMAEKITGRKLSETLGKTCDDIWGKRGTLTTIVINSLKDKCYVNFETNLASPERGIVPVALSSTLLRDAKGKKMGALITIRDLSEMRELEEKVRRADKLSALATMAAGMAHEIKNPLSSMKVLSQLLPLKFNDAEFRKKLQEIFPREIDRIDRIVESLLSFARATALNFEKHDLNQVIEETVKYFNHQAKDVDVKIVKHYGNLPPVEVDASQISQVFSNLILNAIQVMHSGGKIKIETSPGKTIEDVLQNVKIQISDTGPGISEPTLKKLFDPFFTTKHGGTGLGLTISHNIVEGHNGYIDVESQVGKGTSFTVTLPVEQGLI
ncbi:MAG: histidine kinase N-terminal 7TM domain-containing protein [bacterium]